jgi:hypothetical protein
VLRRLARALSRRAGERARNAVLLEALAFKALEGMARAVDPRRATGIAIYVAHVELGFPQRHLGRLYGCSGNYINTMVRRIEAERDDGTPLDAALQQIARRLGEGASAFMKGAT